MSSGAGPIVGFLSGKGGVGKTNVAANVGVAARGLGARVLVVDGDLGLANVDVLFGLASPKSVADVAAGECSLEEALVEGPRGVHVLPAASGRSDLSAKRPRELARLVVPLLAAAARYDLVVVDLGAGIGPTAVGLAACCDRAILVTTPEPTSLADAYATLKVLQRESPKLPVELLVNVVKNAREAHATHDRLERLARRFLGAAPPLIGHLPRDARLVEAVRQQRAVVEAFPLAESSRSLVRLAGRLLRPGAPKRPPRATRNAEASGV